MKNLMFSKVSMIVAGLALLAVFGLAGCGGGGGGGSTSGSGGSATTVATPVIVTAGNIVNQTSKNVDATGGSLTLTQGELSGLTTTFPAGALPKGVSVSIGDASGTLTPNSGTPGKIFSINVPGVKSFGQPATITVPFSGNGVPVPYYIDDSGRLHPVQLISIDRTNHTFTFQTFHASWYTWIVAELEESVASSTDIITNFNPSNDGFKIVNNGSVYNRKGECFGMTSFSLWYFLNHKATKGNFYDKYNSVVGTDSDGKSLTGQNIIATRAFISITQQWNSYMPTVASQQSVTEAERYVAIKNIMKNNSQPVLIYLWHTDGSIGAHSVLCYAYSKSTNTFYMYNPNNPGTRELMTYNATSKKFDAYAGYDGIIYNGGIGLLSLTEPYQNILDDADANFYSSGAAVINIASHTSGQTVTARNISLSGKIESGQVLITKLDVIVGSDTFATNIGTDGTFTIPISLTSGINHIKFNTQGVDIHGNLIDQLPNNMATTEFTLNLDEPKSVVVMTLTWDTNDTDIDTYVADPTNDYSCYYHKVTADGGTLDYDIVSGYGPEHWTLLNTNTVRYGQPYTFRLHYFSDHGHGPSNYTVAIKLYEGTSRETTYYYRGNLSVSNSINDGPNDQGADWRDVASITLTNSATQGVPAAKITSKGIPSMTVPIPDEIIRKTIKQKLSR